MCEWYAHLDILCNGGVFLPGTATESCGNLSKERVLDGADGCEKPLVKIALQLSQSQANSCCTEIQAGCNCCALVALALLHVSEGA